MQSVKIEAGNVHFRHALRRIQSIKPPENTIAHSRINSSRMTFLPKIGESFAPKRSYHGLM